MLTSSLVLAKVDLNWADNQYWVTLFKLIGELNKIYTPKKKEKLKTSEAQKYIK